MLARCLLFPHLSPFYFVFRFQSYTMASNLIKPILSVRHITEEERLQLCFRFSKGLNKERVFNFDRMKTEKLHQTLARIASSISNFLNKKTKKPKLEACVEKNLETSVLLFKGTEKLGDDTDNKDAWVEGTTLQVGDIRYEVKVNLPTIKKMALPNSIMVGFPIYPKVELEFTEIENCVFTWYREYKESELGLNIDLGQSKDVPIDTCVCDVKSAEKDERSRSTSKSCSLPWLKVQEGQYYLPEVIDINHKLKLVCTPFDSRKRQGNEMEVISVNVSAGPGNCPFENRHIYSKKKAENGCFRIVSYNILADLYADSDYSRNFLFPYCPPYALNIDYRKQLLLKELLGYNADLVCLQEVDKKVFVNDLCPAFESEGFDCILKLKTGQVAEGVATLFRKSKFRLIQQHDLNISDELSQNAKYEDLWQKISEKKDFKEKMIERKTVQQVVVLQSVEFPDERLLIATTHLYFHPRASHVRLVQTAVCLGHIEDVLQQHTVQGRPPAVIFCGDLNSAPENALHLLLGNKHVPASHADWYTGGLDEFSGKIELSHNLDIYSACGFPRYTNYVTAFSGCLDYIYVDKKLKTTQVVPLPSHEEVTQYVALPNVVFPSDHLALVCDLTWTEPYLSD